MPSSRFRLAGLLGRIPFWTALSSVAALVLGLSAALSHEGHDHGDEVRPGSATTAYPRVVAQSEQYEIVGILKDGRLSLYLDQFTTNAPVTDASIKVTIGDAEPVDAEAAGDGTYSLASPRLSQTGSVEIVFAIVTKDGDDLLVGSLTLPKGLASQPDATSTAAPGWSQWLGSRPSPAHGQVALAVVTFGLGILFGQLYQRRRFVPAMVAGAAAAGFLILLVTVAFGHEGHDHPGDTAPSAGAAVTSDAPRRLPDGIAFVAKPTQRLLDVRTIAARPEGVRSAVNLIGRVVGDPNRTSVVQSVPGGRVIPLEAGLPRVGQSVRKGEVLAQVDPHLPLADRTTISEKAGEIEQLIAVAEARIRRLRPLAERGAVPQSQVTDIEIELEGLRARRQTIRNTRTEPELLRAPTDGVIAVAKVAPGQVVQPQDVLFQIVDPKGLWVEALVYGTMDPGSLADAAAVTTGGQSMPLSYRGFSRTLQQHAAVVQFAVPDPPPNLSIGQPVTVLAKTGAEMTGLVVPRDAVVRSGNGETIVWLHVEPERFEARPVRTQTFDATRLIVAAGVVEGERIVVRGADLINQIR
jgi:cobalt-zinc-cadmium efflux system membrane fusion protein